MGNLQKHAGPLSDNWHQSQLLLARQIIQRMTDLGIIPVLPAFTGFMPRAAPAYLPFPFLPQSWGSFHFHPLDFFLWRNFITHPIGWDSVATNRGQWEPLVFLRIIPRRCSSSLPYLDPTDPFFRTVGADLLTEVNVIFLCSAWSSRSRRFVRWTSPHITTPAISSMKWPHPSGNTSDPIDLQLTEWLKWFGILGGCQCRNHWNDANGWSRCCLVTDLCSSVCNRWICSL